MKLKLLTVALLLSIACSQQGFSLVRRPSSIYAQVGRLLYVEFNTNGGFAPITFKVDGLPSEIKAQDYYIQGTPRTSGTFPLVVIARDSRNSVDSMILNLIVENPPTPSVSSSTKNIQSSNPPSTNLYQRRVEAYRDVKIKQADFDKIEKIYTDAIHTAVLAQRYLDQIEAQQN